MRVVMVVAHPDRSSLCLALAASARSGLESAGHAVEVIDLYACGFRATMSADEHTAYHGDQPVLDPMVAEHIALITACEALVFVYPTWWSSMPAILKGWLERVMVPGIGFVFNDKGKVRPGLTNVRRIAGISTYGSPRRYVWAVNDNGRRTISRALRLSTGLRTRCSWLGLYAIDTCTEDQRRAFIDRVHRSMAAW